MVTLKCQQNLVKIVEHGDDAIFFDATEALAVIGGDAATSAVITAWSKMVEQMQSGNKHASHLSPIAEALAQLNNQAAIPVLTDALRNDKVLVRSYAATILGQMKVESAVPVLSELLNDEADVKVGRFLRRGWKSSFPKTTNVSRIALNALEMIGTPAALAAIDTWQGPGLEWPAPSEE
jgi:biotin synthase-related radical SAM superfamily protein